MHRRQFLQQVAGGTVATASVLCTGGPSALAASAARGVVVEGVRAGEDLFGYVNRIAGAFDASLYKRILGAANEFKEGDQIIGVAAADTLSRRRARELLLRTRVGHIAAHPPLQDKLWVLLEQSLNREAAAIAARMTLGELKEFLLVRDEPAIKSLMPGLSSDVIGAFS